MDRQYDSDLTNEQWKIIRRLLPKRAKTGRPPLDRRRVLNAMRYIVRTGCQWRLLPRDFPKWKSVYSIFRFFVHFSGWFQHGLSFSFPQKNRMRVR